MDNWFKITPDYPGIIFQEVETILNWLVCLDISGLNYTWSGLSVICVHTGGWDSQVCSNIFMRGKSQRGIKGTENPEKSNINNSLNPIFTVVLALYGL